MNKSPIVPCSACRGTARVPLSKVLLRTYRTILALKEATIPQISRELGEKLSGGAINQRVSKLEKLKLVERVQPSLGNRFYRVSK